MASPSVTRGLLLVQPSGDHQQKPLTWRRYRPPHYTTFPPPLSQEVAGYTTIRHCRKALLPRYRPHYRLTLTPRRTTGLAMKAEGHAGWWLQVDRHYKVLRADGRMATWFYDSNLNGKCLLLQKRLSTTLQFWGPLTLWVVFSNGGLTLEDGANDGELRNDWVVTK